MGYIKPVASALEVLYAPCHMRFTGKKKKKKTPYKISFSKAGVYILYCDHETSLPGLSTEAATFMDAWQCRGLFFSKNN